MKNKILETLKSSDGYISGEAISHTLGISRAAVWKHIKKLKSEGYEIASLTNKGYRLMNAPTAISPSAVDMLLKTKYIARNIIYTDRTGSTNEEAKRLSSSPDGTLFISDHQTDGKGRLGRAWSSPSGTGIFMSLLLKPYISPSDVSAITLIAGLAVCRAIGAGAKIKWPNDVVIGTRKVCGILTEMSAEIDRIGYVVCGIGINANNISFPDELRGKATSVFIETGSAVSRTELIASVMNEFEPLYEKFLKSGFEPISEQYRRLCVTIGRDIRVIFRGNEITGTAVDINKNGGLIVKTENDTITVTSGEVSVRGIYGYI